MRSTDDPGDEDAADEDIARVQPPQSHATLTPQLRSAPRDTGSVCGSTSASLHTVRSHVCPGSRVALIQLRVQQEQAGFVWDFVGPVRFSLNRVRLAQSWVCTDVLPPALGSVLP